MSVFNRFTTSQAIATSVPRFRGTMADWEAELDRMGAMASGKDLAAHLVRCPDLAAADQDLIAMIQANIEAQLEQVHCKPQAPRFEGELADNDNDGLPTP